MKHTVNIPLIRNRVISGLLIVAIAAVLIAIQFFFVCTLNIARPEIMTFVWAFFFIGLPTTVSLVATYLIQRRIHPGFFFRWFAASACALVMVSSVYLPMSFLTDDADDHASTTTEDFVSNWICFPIMSPTAIIEDDSSGAATAVVSIFLLPGILWGLIFERFLSAKRIQKLILLVVIIVCSIWLAATPVKEMADYAISVAIICKWAALVALTLLIAASDKIRPLLTGHSTPQVPENPEIVD